jgi:NADH:ubiquinone oxidoreductase subunit H
MFQALIVSNISLLIKENLKIMTINYILIVKYILLSLSIIVPIILAIAMFTLLERKVLAAIQRRRGPNTVGF